MARSSQPSRRCRPCGRRSQRTCRPLRFCHDCLSWSLSMTSGGFVCDQNAQPLQPRKCSHRNTLGQPFSVRYHSDLEDVIHSHSYTILVFRMRDILELITRSKSHHLRLTTGSSSSDFLGKSLVKLDIVAFSSLPGRRCRDCGGSR